MRTKKDACVRLIELLVGIVLVVALMALQLPARGVHLAYAKQSLYNNRYSFEYYITRYTLWNDGTDAVVGETLAVPLRITLDNTDSVFYIQATDVSNPTSLVEVDKQLETGYVGLSFVYLNPGDRFTLTMYHTAPVQSALQGEVSAGRPLPQRRLESPLLTIPLAAYAVILAVAMTGQLAYILLRLLRRPGDAVWTPMDWRAFFGLRPKERYRERRPHRVAAALRRHWPVLCVLVFLALYPAVYL